MILLFPAALLGLVKLSGVLALSGPMAAGGHRRGRRAHGVRCEGGGGSAVWS